MRQPRGFLGAMVFSPRRRMVYIKELGNRFGDAAQQGAKFAGSLLRAFGYAFTGAVSFVDREVEYAARAVKKARDKGGTPRSAPSSSATTVMGATKVRRSREGTRSPRSKST